MYVSFPAENCSESYVYVICMNAVNRVCPLFKELAKGLLIRGTKETTPRVRGFA